MKRRGTLSNITNKKEKSKTGEYWAAPTIKEGSAFPKTGAGRCETHRSEEEKGYRGHKKKERKRWL